MRKSRNGQRRAFAAFTKFSVLLMCFATVFALVLTAGVFDIGESDMNANVAEASVSGGSTTALDTSMRFDMEDFHTEYGKNPNASSLQFTMRLDEYISAGNSDALSAYTSLYGWTDASVSVGFWNDYNNVAGDFGGYAETPDWRRAPTSVVALNLRTPTLFTSLAQAGYTVDVSVSAKLMLGNSVPSSEDETAGLGIIGSSQPQAASVFGNENWSQENGALYFESGWWTDAGWANSGKPLSRNLMNLDRSYPHLDGNMSYLTIAIYRPSEWHSFSGSTAYVFADDTTITFTVTLTNPLRSDGNGPQVASTSYLTQDNKGDFFDVSGSVAGNINAVTQTSIWDGNTTNPTINLDGVAVRKNAETIDGHNYAKSVTINLQDLGQNGVAASGTQANYYAGLAGLSFNGGAQTPTVYDGGQNTGNIGYGEGYYVWQVEAARDKGVLTLYFNDNVSNLKVRVYDSGNSYLEITVNVDGIKSGGDDMNRRGVSVTADEYMTDDNNGKWLWDPDYVLSPSFTKAGAGAYAQVWFYAVKRYDSLAGANTEIGVNTAEGTTSWQPIGYSTNDSGFRTVSGGLEFDISTGMLSGIPAVNGDGGNGSGYYRFEFYNMNYAGYVSSSPVVRVVKVDIDTPDPTTTLKYDKTKNPLVAGTLNDGEIYTDQMAYVSTDLTVTVTLNKVNFSGNKVSVLGADGNVYIFFVGYDGGITGIYTVSEDGSLTPASGWSDNTQTGSVFAKVTVTSKKTETGDGLTFTAVYTGVAEDITTKQHDFVVYNNADELESALTGCLNGTDTAWNGVGGTRLWFDHIGIDDVTFGAPRAMPEIGSRMSGRTAATSP